jgi:hypothetical protein
VKYKGTRLANTAWDDFLMGRQASFDFQSGGGTILRRVPALAPAIMKPYNLRYRGGLTRAYGHVRIFTSTIPVKLTYAILYRLHWLGFISRKISQLISHDSRQEHPSVSSCPHCSIGDTLPKQIPTAKYYPTAHHSSIQCRIL